MISEEQRIKAIPELMVWARRDPTVKILVRVVLQSENQPSVGHLARFSPDAFDELYEESSALARNDL